MLAKQKNIKFSSGRNLTLCYALLTIIIVVVDCFGYYQLQQKELLLTNLPLLPILLGSIIHIIIDKNTWKNWFTANTLAITLNISASVIIRAINADGNMFIVMNTMHAIAIIFASGVVLRKFWTYIYTFIYGTCLIIASFIIDSGQLNGKMLSLIVVLVGTAIVTNRYVKTYQKSRKEIIRLQQQTQHLEKTLHKEQCEISTIVEKIKQKANNNNISKELDELKDVCNNGVSNTLTDFIANSSSEEAIFIKKVTQRYPDLSPRELKLCVLLTQGLSSKEIAEKMSCAPNSIKVYRSQLRKRLGVKPSQNLVDQINSFHS